MDSQLTPVGSGAWPTRPHLAEPGRYGPVHAVPVPATALLAEALPRVDWSDAYAVAVPADAPRDPQAWADAIFRGPPPWIRALFGVREVLVRTVGIDPGGRHVFATVSRRPDEVLLGTDQGHLGFRASVLVESGRVVLSTVVQLRNRRGRAYSAVVRTVHPWVVRSMLARAARRLTVAAPTLGVRIGSDGPSATTTRPAGGPPVLRSVEYVVAMLAAAVGRRSQSTPTGVLSRRLTSGGTDVDRHAPAHV